MNFAKKNICDKDNKFFINDDFGFWNESNSEHICFGWWEMQCIFLKLRNITLLSTRATQHRGTPSRLPGTQGHQLRSFCCTVQPSSDGGRVPRGTAVLLWQCGLSPFSLILLDLLLACWWCDLRRSVALVYTDQMTDIKWLVVFINFHFFLFDFFLEPW